MPHDPLAGLGIGLGLLLKGCGRPWSISQSEISIFQYVAAIFKRKTHLIHIARVFGVG